jgi:TPR repeat protein
MDTHALDQRIGSLRLAAEDGHAESMFLLAIAYAQGQGLERNDVAAARWFHQAARKGHLRAKTSMGYLYSTGRGVRQDPVLAYLFFVQAAAKGDPLATDLIVRLRRTMSPTQLKEAEKRAESTVLGPVSA